jgi:hypothetical protein
VYFFLHSQGRNRLSVQSAVRVPQPAPPWSHLEAVHRFQCIVGVTIPESRRRIGDRRKTMLDLADPVAATPPLKR